MDETISLRVFLELVIRAEKCDIKTNEGPFTNYVMHLGEEGGSNCVTKCHRGWEGGLSVVLRNTMVYILLTLNICSHMLVLDKTCE